ncbi:protein CUSTOS [Aquarana catesbeiana]|uniref:protein CUSTOS n=1 Tax=Aquarana catesbeiana TaxID=8400 RepID=UPI003CCA6661
MAAPRSHLSEDGSDSSSSDEERERLKEAAWEPPGVKKCVQHQQDSVATVMPSLRVRPDNHEHDGNELQTTPEFRAHVAKKLASILDSCIKEIPGSSSLQEPKEETEPEEEGFRLLSTSIPGDPGTVAPSTLPKRRAAHSSSEDSEEENERRCREAAVSGLDILKHSALYPVAVQSSDTPSNHQLTKKHKKKKKKTKDRGLKEGSDIDHQCSRQDHESRKDNKMDTESQSNPQDLRQEHETNGFKMKKKKKRKNKQFVNETKPDY